MYRRYRLNVTADQFRSVSVEEGRKLYVAQKKIVRPELMKFVAAGGAISAEKLLEAWFPAVEADIFISHAHIDETLALKVAREPNT